MKAVICTKYGAPDVLQLSEVNIPRPNDNELLVKIHATAVTASDCAIRTLQVPGGHQFPIKQLMQLAMRLFIGFSKPRNPVLGLVFSGVVESVGKGLSQFNPGDAVFGFTGVSRGAYAEYKLVSKKEIERGELSLRPSSASHDEAAAIVYGGVLALHFMRNANIKNGHKVLIYGASGAIGTMAVQLAKHYEAEVTAVCSTGNFEMMTSIGADKLIDYTKNDAVDQLERYDFVLDAVGKNKSSAFKKRCSKSLTQKGKYVSVDDGLLNIESQYLKTLSILFESGNIKAVIDRIYPLRDITNAHEYVERGHKKGNVLVQVKS